MVYRAVAFLLTSQNTGAASVTKDGSGNVRTCVRQPFIAANPVLRPARNTHHDIGPHCAAQSNPANIWITQFITLTRESAANLLPPKVQRGQSRTGRGNSQAKGSCRRRTSWKASSHGLHRWGLNLSGTEDRNPSGHGILHGCRRLKTHRPPRLACFRRWANG